MTETQVDMEFAAIRGAARAWQEAHRLHPALSGKGEPTPTMAAGSAAADSGDFADVYASGGARAPLASADIEDLVVGADWLDRSVGELADQSPPASGMPFGQHFGSRADAVVAPPVTPTATLFTGVPIPFRADAAQHPIRSQLKQRGELAPSPSENQPLRSDKAEKHERRGLRRVFTTFKTALLCFLALQLMSEVTTSEAAEGVALPHGIEVPLMTVEALMDVPELTVTVEELVPIAVGEDIDLTGGLVVFGGEADASAPAAGLNLSDLLSGPDAIVRVSDGEPELPAMHEILQDISGPSDLPALPDGSIFVPATVERSPLYDSLFPVEGQDTDLA